MKNCNINQGITEIAANPQAVLIDARTPAEWAEGIIENALMINVMDEAHFIEMTSNFDTNKNYYIYCRSGMRSMKACQILESQGCKSTCNLDGGIVAFQGNTVIPA